MKTTLFDSIRTFYFYRVINPVAVMLHRKKCGPNTFARVFRFFPFSHSVTMWQFKRKYPDPNQVFGGM